MTSKEVMQMKNEKDENRDGCGDDRAPARRRGNPFGRLFDDEFFGDFFNEPFPGLFPDFDERFQRMREDMDRRFGRTAGGPALERPEGEGDEKEGRPSVSTRTFGPYVYGYRMHMGPDGVPHVETFSNMGTGDGDIRFPSERPSLEGRPAGPGEKAPRHSDGGSCPSPAATTGEGPQTPMYEVMNCRDSMILVAEVPGIDRKEIDLRLDGDVLRMDARGKYKSYTLTVQLPAHAKLDRRSMHYRNGLLELKLKKSDPASERKADRKGSPEGKEEGAKKGAGGDGKESGWEGGEEGKCGMDGEGPSDGAGRKNIKVN
jgi:HSP20 family protein